MSVKVGFSQTDLMDVLPEKRQCKMPLSCRGFYLSKDQNCSFFLIADFMDFNRQAVELLQNAVQPALPPSAQIHIVTTHNHGGASFFECDTNIFCARAFECASQALANACEAKVRFAVGALDESISIVRRLFVSAVEGSFSCFYGIDKIAAGNGEEFVSAALQNLTANRLTFTGSTSEQPAGNYTFPAADDQLAVWNFCSLTGEPIGSIVRFACHAVCCNLSGYYSSDYPGYLRKNMEKALGGTAIFLNGACAEIAPAIKEKSPENGRRFADILSKKALELLSGSQFQLVEHFCDTVWEINLPVRKELLEQKVNIPAAATSDPVQKKRELEALHLQNNLPFLNSIYRNDENAHPATTAVSCALLELTGSKLLFFSGETFFSTAQEITAAFPDEQLVTVTEHGRTIMYIPPITEYRRGGYEPACAVLAENGEECLKKSLIANLKKHFSAAERISSGK